MFQRQMMLTLRRASKFYTDYGRVFAGLMLLQLVTYSYFFTSLIFTNHTFPNSWVFPYPSYLTWDEGRWLADLVIWLQGGSGVQPFQMSVAVALQSINGILFARFLGLEKPSEVLFAAAFLCLYPAFLDNYSFVSAHITFAIGDTFALLGILHFRSTVHSPQNATLSTILFVFALASYQPKISLLGLLCVCNLAIYVAGNYERRPFSLKETLLETAYISGVFLGACLVYLVFTKLTMMHNLSYVGKRVYINSTPEMLQAALSSYRRFLRYYTVGSDYLPRSLRFLPTLGIALGCLALLIKAYRKHMTAVMIVAVLLLLIPVVLRGSYIINKNSWDNFGRIVFVNGYALLFFLSCALQVERMKKFVVGILATFIYCFIVLGTQESNAAAIKTVYELNMINRIASRIETVAEDLYQRKYALVVAGHYPEFARHRYVRTSNRSNEPHAQSFAFEAYRQPEILNYFFGRSILLRPTPAQMGKALASARERRPWPAKESVYVLEDVIVVVLEEYRPDMPRTWTTEQ